jgi:uncharacterized protein (DUF433 family)
MANRFVEVNPTKCNGKPVVAGTRIPVTVVLDQLGESGSIRGLLAKYPELTEEQVKGVLEYCHSLIEHTELEMAQV